MSANITRTTTSLIGSLTALQLSYQDIGSGETFPTSPVFTSIGTAQKVFLALRFNTPNLKLNPVKILLLFSTDAAGLCKSTKHKEVIIADLESAKEYLKILDISTDITGFSYVSVQLLNTLSTILPSYIALIVDDYTLNFLTIG